MDLSIPAHDRAADLGHPPSRAPDGEVVYAIGDVHGEADLLAGLLKAIRLDALGRREPRKRLILLGDLIDRGAQSPRVLDIAMSIDPVLFETTVLLGNHEAVLLEFLEDPTSGPEWVRHGGAETLRAYGVDLPPASADRDWAMIGADLERAMPQAHLAFLRGLPRRFEVGDYLFCHAGVRPGVPLSEQSDKDLIWIRHDFLDDPAPLEKVVVHGHTPNTELVSDHRRIGIDTGAYATGVLSAVRLAGSERAFFQTRRGRRA